MPCLLEHFVNLLLKCYEFIRHKKRNYELKQDVCSPEGTPSQRELFGRLSILTYLAIAHEIHMSIWSVQLLIV